MGGKNGLIWSVIVLVIALMIFKIYPNYPTGKLGVLFYHCSSCHEERQELQSTYEGINKLNIDGSSNVNIIIHGYTESSIRPWIVNLTNALLSRDPGSVVIMVDYYDLTTISRPYMMHNVRSIANVTANFIDMLVQYKNVRLSNIHLMGFSLGGRISGLVGNRIKSHGKIGRITGIDASYPWLTPATNDEYLDSSDAEFVVNIRTSKIGALSPPGHVDFYVNGGMSQPGCEKYLLDVLIHICNHYRAVLLMVEAVTNDLEVFPACKCKDWHSYINNQCICDVVNHFGLNTNPELQGSFYLTTNPEAPFSRSLK